MLSTENVVVAFDAAERAFEIALKLALPVCKWRFSALRATVADIESARRSKSLFCRIVLRKTAHTFANDALASYTPQVRFTPMPENRSS
jgi:hypothetical protein